MGLLRQMLKPLFRYWKDPEYRAYLRVQKECRRRNAKHVTVWLDGYVAEGNDGPSLLHQYEEIIQRKSFDFTATNSAPLIYVCGANIGLEVLHLTQLYPDSRIKAYEPDPELFAILKSNIERNDTRHEAINAAVYTQNGKLPFAPDGKLGGKVGAGPLEVRAIRLRDALETEVHIELLIMDIEGGETEVLKDCESHLPKIDHIFVEWHSDQSRTQNLGELLSILERAGFRYRLNNNMGIAPFQNAEIENGFDAMVEIYATRQKK